MRLIIRRDGTLVRVEEVREGVAYLGRSRRNDIVLSDASVSRRHAKIFTQEGVLLLEDLKSVNGTRMRGEPLRRAELDSGDTFEIGPFELTLEEDTQPIPADDVAEEDPAADTTFAEAVTDMEPDENTPPPSRSDDSDFLAAIAVRPGRTSGTKPPTARLVRRDGGDAGEEIPIDRPEISFGRAKTCDVVVDAPDVEERQALIKKSKGGYTVVDTGETTGTFVDGVPVRERELEPYDVIQVGSARFEYREDADVQGNVMEHSRSPHTPSRRASLVRIDWRIFLLLGLIGGVVYLWLSRAPSPHRTDPTPQVPSPVVSEAERAERFNMDRSRRLMAEGELDQAEARLRVILESSADHKEAGSLLSEIVDLRRKAEEEKLRTARQAAEREAKVQSLLETGDAARAKGEFEAAAEAYKGALRMEKNHEETLEALRELREMEAKASREEEAQRKSEEEIRLLYVEGVRKFEMGDFGGAETSLHEVAARDGGRYQASAKKILADIDRQTEQAVESKLEAVRRAMEGGDLLAAHAAVLPLAKQFPRRENVSALLGDVRSRLEARARQAYMQGVAYLEIVEDRKAALEQFKESLALSPDTNSEYHVKSKKKIEELSRKGP